MKWGPWGHPAGHPAGQREIPQQKKSIKVLLGKTSTNRALGLSIGLSTGGAIQTDFGMVLGQNPPTHGRHANMFARMFLFAGMWGAAHLGIMLKLIGKILEHMDNVYEEVWYTVLHPYIDNALQPSYNDWAWMIVPSGTMQNRLVPSHDGLRGKKRTTTTTTNKTWYSIAHNSYIISNTALSIAIHVCSSSRFHWNASDGFAPEFAPEFAEKHMECVWPFNDLLKQTPGWLSENRIPMGTPKSHGWSSYPKFNWINGLDQTWNIHTPTHLQPISNPYSFNDYTQTWMGWRGTLETFGPARSQAPRIRAWIKTSSPTSRAEPRFSQPTHKILVYHGISI